MLMFEDAKQLYQDIMDKPDSASTKICDEKC